MRSFCQNQRYESPPQSCFYNLRQSLDLIIQLTTVILYLDDLGRLAIDENEIRH